MIYIPMPTRLFAGPIIITVGMGGAHYYFARACWTISGTLYVPLERERNVLAIAAAAGMQIYANAWVVFAHAPGSEFGGGKVKAR